MRNYKKIIVAIAMSLMMGSLQAQIFIQDDEFEGHLRSGYEEFELITPYQGGNYDEYEFTPTGSGLLALTGLAGAYLIAKRKKNIEK